MDDLVKFLADRYAEQWSAARDRELAAGLDASRETRGVDAKRAVLAEHGGDADPCGFAYDMDLLRICFTLRHLGTEFSDHPDYDESWGPP